MDVIRMLEKIIDDSDFWCVVCSNHLDTDNNGHSKGCQLKATIDALRSGQLVVMDKQDEPVCVWTVEHDFDGEPHYASSCGSESVMTDGNLWDNDLRYCAFCGKKIVEIKKEQGNE